MSDRMKNLLIGIFVLAAIAIISFLILFLHPFLGDEGQTLRVRFADIDKVNVGTRVLYAGRPVGEVVDITAIDRKKHGIDHEGEIYVYELKLAVDSSVRVYNSDKISLRTSGLLGEKSVSIDPEPLKPGEELRLVNKEVIYAADMGSVEETFQDLKDLGNKIDRLMDLAVGALEVLDETKAWENIGETMENMRELTASFVDPEDGEDSIPAIRRLITNLEQASENILEITEDLKTGKGTMGRLLSGEELYLQAKAIFAKGETVMDDINHYGLLFNLDSGWKRLRARRMNLAQKLSSPQQFRNFFNDEINQISTSLARVSQVMGETSCYDLSQDCQFIKVFSDLLRRIECLEEAVQMYNIQLTDAQLNECAMRSY